MKNYTQQMQAVRFMSLSLDVRVLWTLEALRSPVSRIHFDVQRLDSCFNRRALKAIYLLWHINEKVALYRLP